METIIAGYNRINECIIDNSGILNRYLLEIDDKNDIYLILENLEKNTKFDQNTKPFKEIILNIKKSFAILSKRIESGDEIFKKSLEKIRDKNLAIKSLQNYINQQHQKNKIEFTKF